jgi:hypothetical protein
MMTKINYQKLLINSSLAVTFGVIYWMFLENIQSAIVNRIYNCDFCDRCANILYDKEQIVLAFCAALALLVGGFLKMKGWRGVLKTIAVSYLCFQVYSLVTIWSVIRSEECTALHRPRMFPIVALVFLLIDMLITSAAWAGICAAPLAVFNLSRAIIFPGEDDSQRVDFD